jgi:uncharacterized protein YukE
LKFNPLTTQIESHDWQAELYAAITLFNRILHNLSLLFEQTFTTVQDLNRYRKEAIARTEAAAASVV